MKYSSRILSLLLLVSMTVFFAGCDKSEGGKTSKKDQQIKALVGTWSVNTAKLDGADVDYDGFQLEISGDEGDPTLAFVAIDRPEASPWDSEGSFSFGSDVEHDLIRADDVDIEYTVTANTLTMSFTYTGTPFNNPGRVESVAGDWVFTFTK